MEISDALSGVGGTPQLEQKELDKDAFLKLMVAQFQNQDPLEPTSNENLVLQLAQFSTLEGTQNLNDNFTDFISNSNISSASTLIGKDVRYLDGGLTVGGIVDKVKLQGGDIMLEIDGFNVTPSQVISIGNQNQS